MSTPVITIFVRHSAGCKYEGDEFAKRCTCRKHFRWTQDGKQFRQKAGTRTWAEAEELKRNLEDALSGRAPKAGQPMTIRRASELFVQEKRNQGHSANGLGKHIRELARLADYADMQGVRAVNGLTRDFLTGFVATWESLYPSSTTRSKARERLRSFLRYCHDAEWLTRIPRIAPIKAESLPTMPLTPAEYSKLLDATYGLYDDPKKGERIRALIELMRWSGLAVRDAVTLEREEIIHDKKKGLYRIVTSRQKIGTDVSVPIPPAVAKQVLAVLNGNPRYVFWSGNGLEDTATRDMITRLSAVFEAAKIKTEGLMKSHRLRDTFACELLEKGVPLEEVSKLLGHASILTTERHYSKWIKGRQDRLDNLVIGSW